MIFVTVGTQIGFDRLIRAIDVTGRKHPEQKFLAQIGSGEYIPEHIEYFDYSPPLTLESHLKEAELVIAHAGMGTIIKCLEYGKKLIVIPRLVEFGEHRNDHQMDTAKSFEKLGYIKAAFSVEELETLVDEFIKGESVFSMKNVDSSADQQLLKTIEDFLT